MLILNVRGASGGLSSRHETEYRWSFPLPAKVAMIYLEHFWEGACICVQGIHKNMLASNVEIQVV